MKLTLLTLASVGLALTQPLETRESYDDSDWEGPIPGKCPSDIDVLAQVKNLTFVASTDQFEAAYWGFEAGRVKQDASADKCFDWAWGSCGDEGALEGYSDKEKGLVLDLDIACRRYWFGFQNFRYQHAYTKDVKKSLFEKFEADTKFVRDKKEGSQKKDCEKKAKSQSHKVERKHKKALTSDSK